MTKKHFVFILIVSTVACTVRQVPNEAPKKTTLAEVIKKQVLLTNHADFTTDRTLIGASAFLIYYNDTVYAVTAKHLIGTDGGVEPKVWLSN